MDTTNSKEKTKHQTGSNDCSKGEKQDLNLSLAPYALLAFLRVALTLLPQTGYIQPDEYFQSIEIVNEDLFDVEASRPWEFNATKPIRSVALPYFYAGLPIYLLKIVAPYFKLFLGFEIITPYFLLVTPRLFCCLLSFLNDWSLYKICILYGQNYRARLLTLASSYVILVYGTHTFSNSIEMALTSVLIYFVAGCMYRSDQVISQDEYLQECYRQTESMRERVRLSRLRRSLPGHSFRSCAIVAALTVLGVFNRPTFLAFAFTPVFFWLHRGLGSKSVGLWEFHLRILLLDLDSILVLFGFLGSEDFLDKMRQATPVDLTLQHVLWRTSPPTLLHDVVWPPGIAVPSMDNGRMCVPHCLCALPITIILILVDSFYFGYLTWNEILQKKVSLENNFVITPYNFIQYNMYTSNLANHGLHPRVTHLLLNMPLLYNVLALAAFSAVLSLLHRVVRRRWSELPRIQSIIGLMTSAYIAPIALLSIFPHQEPRFLIPITLPLVFLHSQRIRNVNELQQISEKQDKGVKVFVRKDIVHGYKDKILTLWYLINMVMVLVYGFVHQAGVYPLMDHSSVVMREKPRLTAVYLVTSFVYPLPVSLLTLKQSRVTAVDHKTGKRYQTARDFLTYEMGLSESVENATLKAKAVLEASELTWQEKRLKYLVYLALPTSRLAEFQMLAFKTNVTYSVEQIFYPHISTEAMPDFSLGQFTDCEDHSAAVCRASDSQLSLDFAFHYFSHIVHQCGLALIRIKK